MRMVAKAGCGMAGVQDKKGVIEHKILEGERRYIRDAKVVVPWVAGATAAGRVRQTNAVSPRLAVGQRWVRGALPVSDGEVASSALRATIYSQHAP